MGETRQLNDGDEFLIVRSTESDNAGISELEFRMAPGGTCGFHFHKQFIKTLIPVEGTLAYLQKGHDIRLLRPGDSQSIAPGTTHRYFNPGTGFIRFRVLIEPGHTGYEQGWKLGFELAEQQVLHWWKRPALLVRMLELRAMKDVHWSGWKRLLNPVIRILLRLR